MAKQIVNAAPMVIDYGTQDLSKRQVPRDPIAIPQHLPKYYTFAEKGPTGPQLVTGVDLTNIYGDETFNQLGKYCTHSTPFILGTNSLGNSIMLERLIPDDAGPEATLIAWLDVLPTTVDLYERNPDGSVKTDPATGDPIVVGVTAGYKVKWVVTNYTTKEQVANFGQLTQTTGDQTDTDLGVQSIRYPIFEFKASSVGARGNMTGLRLWAPNAQSSSMPTSMMATEKAYPYFIQMIERSDALSTPTVTPTIYAEQNVMFTLKPDVIDPVTTQRIGAEDIIIQSYESLSDPRYAQIFGAYDTLKVYDANIDTLVGLFQAAEIPFINEFSDFTADPADRHLFNIVSGSSSLNVPYNSFIFTDAENGTRFSNTTNVYSAGSSDGTMTNEVFDGLVSTAVQAYADELNPVQELAVNVESCMYDSGFSVNTKKDLIKMISIRKDTYVVLGCYEAGGRTLGAAEEQSLAISLRTALQMYPESDYFGTPVMRGMIIGRSAVIRNSQYTDRLPLTYEVMMKCAKRAGAGNGRWTNGANFDGAPGSILDYMTDVSITWVPASVRNRNWDVGLNWVQAYDRSSFFFPALKTVYDDDTSVLNSLSTMMAICQLNKVAHAAWREFSGVAHLTDAQLTQRVNDYVTNATQNIFDGQFVIKPDFQITDRDALRGFSGTLPIQIYANNMFSVMTTYVQAFRMDSLGT